MSKAAVKVTHEWYGCETGCCGHKVEVDAPDGRDAHQFFFEHPDDLRGEAFARHLVESAIEYGGAVAKIIEACGGYELTSFEAVDD